MARNAVTVKIEGVDKAIAKIRNMNDEIQAEIKKEIAASAFKVQADARKAVVVDTGILKSSIGVAFERGGLSAEVGPTTGYGGHVEYGTSPHKTPEGAELFARSIEAWARRHGIEDWQALRAHIRKHGTAPRPFLNPALKAETPHFRTNLRAAVKRALGK